MTAAARQPREQSESGWESGGDESRTPEISKNSLGNLLVPRAVVCLWPGVHNNQLLTVFLVLENTNTGQELARKEALYRDKTFSNNCMLPCIC